MAKIILVCLFLLSSASSRATETFELPVEQGNWTISGSVATTYNSFVGTANSASPAFEYFVLRHFSIGLVSNYYSDPEAAFWGWGPSVSYYFATHNKRWAFFLNTAFEQNGSSLNGQAVWTYQARSGALYFLARQIATGPVLTYSGTYNPKTYDQTYLSLSARFWIFF